MGQCISQATSAVGVSVQVPDIGPSPDAVKEIVQRHAPVFASNLLKYFLKYKTGMDESAPNEYVCKEVISKKGKDGKLTLVKGVDDDKAVKQAALLAAGNEDVRLHVKDAVWEQVAGSVMEKARAIEMDTLRNQAVNGARKATDTVVDKCINKILDALAKKIQNGEKLAEDEGVVSVPVAPQA